MFEVSKTLHGNNSNGSHQKILIVKINNLQWPGAVTDLALSRMSTVHWEKPAHDTQKIESVHDTQKIEAPVKDFFQNI